MTLLIQGAFTKLFPFHVKDEVVNQLLSLLGRGFNC